jgi:glutamyl-tRNA reductase
MNDVLYPLTGIGIAYQLSVSIRVSGMEGIRSMELGERLSSAESGTIMVCGLSYHRSPVEVRERIAIPPARLPDALRFVADQPGVRECMVLSTCNRTEIYMSVNPWIDGRELFLGFGRSLRDFDPSGISDQIYVLRDLEAVNHLFRVASSLDSLVLGEPQILGQTKAAFREAEKFGSIDRDLHRLVPRAFAAAKQVRNETGICESAVSVSYAAVQLARKIFEDLSGKCVVLLGAGKMTELSAMHLREAGARSITIANRTMSKAEELAARCSGLAVEFERRLDEIANADIVVCSTDAPHFILSADSVREILRSRPSRPLLILDISIPRNVDPSVSALDGVYLFNIDDLDHVVDANRSSRRAEAARAEELLQSALEKFARDEADSLLGPDIAVLRSRVRSICLGELERFEQKIPGLTAEDRKELEQMVHRIAQKILHPAIMELKTAGARKTPGSGLDLVRRLFGVDRVTSSQLSAISHRQ